MARLYLIRHARPSTTWGEEPDPALDAIGREQAEAAADALSKTLERIPIYTSPLRRCRETAHPLELLWQRKADVFDPAAEIPSPPVDPRTKQQWLKAAMLGTWQDLNRCAPPGSPDYLAWRQALLDGLARMPGDAVIFTHFIAINVVVGTAQSRDDVVCFRPDHASVTCVQVENEGVRLLELGRQSDTAVLVRG
jgi:broad specificity phosphatase PhoE